MADITDFMDILIASEADQIGWHRNQQVQRLVLKGWE